MTVGTVSEYIRTNWSKSDLSNPARTEAAVEIRNFTSKCVDTSLHWASSTSINQIRFEINQVSPDVSLQNSKALASKFVQNANFQFSFILLVLITEQCSHSARPLLKSWSNQSAGPIAQARIKNLNWVESDSTKRAWPAIKFSLLLYWQAAGEAWSEPERARKTGCDFWKRLNWIWMRASDELRPMQK